MNEEPNPGRGETQLTLRLLAILLLIVVVVTASIGLVARTAIAQAREQQHQQTREYLAARLRSLDEGWNGAAYATRQLLELWQAGAPGATPEVRDARLRTLLLSLADQGDFSHAVVVDVRGQQLLRHGTRSQDSPRLPAAPDAAGMGWVYSEADRTVYRTVAGPLRYGEQAARLVLYFPVDNALLSRMAFPGTRLALLHDGAPVAHTDPRAPGASAPTESGATPRSLPWGQQDGAPTLEIDQRFVAPLSDRQLLWVAAAGAGAFIAIGWLVLGRWVRSQSHRLHQLQQAATGFAATQMLSPEIDERIGQALVEADDIARLARELRAMMVRIGQAREEQASAGAALAALNSTLEARVAERTQALERARDDALAASRAKEQFLSNMSHELRTPMNGMLGALELMSQTELSPRQAQFVEVAGASGEALLGILNEVLDFAKIGAGQPQLVREPMDVNAVARSVTTLFAASAQRKAIAIRLDADAALAGWRLGDSMRLRQVLMNLAGNAMKFTQRGEIVVRTRQLGAPGADRIAFAVSDTGPGIPADQRERIFEAFVQADGPGQARQGGTGLGLAISRLLVRAMGGELELHSHVGEGSTFSFEIDLPPVPGGVALPAAREPAAFGSLVGRVLLVEDNGVNRLIAIAMLESMGLEVIQAENGEQALERLASTSVSLVLMDCQMPVMDGYEATRRLREAERLADRPRLPVVALTANVISGDVERCFGAGMDAHLGKPFTLAQLHATLQPWLAAAAGRA